MHLPASHVGRKIALPDGTVHVTIDCFMVDCTTSSQHNKLMDIYNFWTWQSRTLNPFSGEYDVRKSQYYNDPTLPGIKTAYSLLANSLGTDKLVWCYLRPNEHCIFDSIAEKDVEWSFSIDAAKVLAFVDTEVWDGVIRTRSQITKLPPALFLPGRDGSNVSAIVEHPISARDLEVREVTCVIRPGQPIDKQTWKLVSSQ